MKIEKGRVVKANAGRDKGSYFVITDMKDNYVFIADGKRRKLSLPKRKNLKHLRFTDNVIELNDMTDKKLRNVLSRYLRRAHRNRYGEVLILSKEDVIELEGVVEEALPNAMFRVKLPNDHIIFCTCIR